jgi:putative two-component system response regulator
VLDDILRAIPARNVGLAGVPDRILNHTGELNATDQNALERHPHIGCQILDKVVARHGQALPFARVARDVIRSHHERWDGGGFPDHLKNTAIPPAARLVAVAEAYDALRQPHDKVSGLSHEAAIDGLLHESKGYFDPVVVDAMVAAHERFAEVFASIPD